jgi:photosystem II stability/assembly factor-like uncharacterized protein
MKKLLALIICNLSFLCFISGQWQELNNGLVGGRVGGIYVDPVTNNVFAGTFSCGIFSSSDDGQHWTTANNGLPDQVYNVESFARSGNNLFAACSNTNGFFLSTDNGNTWISKNNGIENVNINTLSLAGTRIYAGTGYGIYKSEDNGDNWTEVSNGLPDRNSLYVKSIAVKDNLLYAGTSGGLFVSGDEGGTWTKINLGIDYDFVNTVMVYNEYIIAGIVMGRVSISADNGTTWTTSNTGFPFGIDFTCMASVEGKIYAGTYNGGIYVSTDNGNTWIQSNNGLSSLIVNKIAVNGNKIFAATEAGIFISTNSGSNWNEVNNGLTNIRVTALANTSDRLIAGTGGNGLFSSADKGNTWTKMNIGLKDWEQYVFCLTVNGNNLFLGTLNGIFVSHDNGINWAKQILPMQVGINIITEEFAISGENVYAATTEGIYISPDNGVTWTTNHALKDEGIFSIAAKGNNIYAGTCVGIFLSTDNGTTWTSITNGLSLTDYLIWAIVPKENNVFFACLDGVFVSPDNGGSWTKVNEELGSVNNLSLSGNNLIAGTYNESIYLSSDNGSTWTPLKEDLKGPALITEAIAVTDNDIYIGTYKGVWKRQIPNALILDVSPTSLIIKASDKSTASFNIISNTDWTVSCPEEWLTMSQVSGSGNATIDLTAEANHSKESRNANVTVSGYGLPDKVVLVTQNEKKEKVKKTEVDIYPNPVKDHLTISFDDYSDMVGYSVKIINRLGRVVFISKITQPEIVINDVSRWGGKGVYVLQLLNAHKKVVVDKKIILK